MSWRLKSPATPLFVQQEGRISTTYAKASGHRHPKHWHNICYYRIPLSQNIVVFNTLRPRQNRRHFADDIFKCIFLNENAWISLKSSLKFVPKVRINNIPSLVQIMAWRRPGDKPLSEPMMVSLLTHICVTRPQWVLMERTEAPSVVLDKIFTVWF